MEKKHKAPNEISKRPCVKPCPKCGRKRGRTMVCLDYNVIGYYRVCECGFEGFVTSYKTKIGEYWNTAVEMYEKNKNLRKDDIYGKRV